MKAAGGGRGVCLAGLVPALPLVRTFDALKGGGKYRA